ncbi:hypothetical protein K437DRAFT_50115 [Tilletiaria anomala UBC 951]|uniref:Uncharacterized protein n=1 Tax=Tilletiaria anomala (strain ATCC 24038 / CBS 436.72 / UBC 951) TaxID=1037660 RepID=A0A066WCD7_TILAU|nr:uncharacterized protein K437DRAFT_50115 [Tilletiaria anomala UBC 951]KDN51386.1 hypothetical protein K437DRAFT_50115 [Tilletiaria anomala UBC 951]
MAQKIQRGLVLLPYDEVSPRPSFIYVTDAAFAFQMALAYSWISVSQCSRIHRLIPILYLLGIAPAQLLLLLRCWVLWGRRYPLLLGFLLPYWIAVIVIQAIAIPHFQPFAAVGFVTYTQPGGAPTDFSYCTSAGRGVFLSLFWVMPMSLDFVLLVLVVVKVLVQRNKPQGITPVSRLMLKQQLGYFVLVFIPFLISSVLMTVTNPILQSISDPPAAAMAAIASTRVVHSLKSEMEHIYSSAVGSTPRPLFGTPRREVVSGITSSTKTNSDVEKGGKFSSFGQTSSSMTAATVPTPRERGGSTPAGGVAATKPDFDLDMLNPLVLASNGMRGAHVYRGDYFGSIEASAHGSQSPGRGAPGSRHTDLRRHPPGGVHHDGNQHHANDGEAQRTFEALRARASARPHAAEEIGFGLTQHTAHVFKHVAEADKDTRGNRPGRAEQQICPICASGGYDDDDDDLSPCSSLQDQAAAGPGPDAGAVASHRGSRHQRPRLFAQQTFGQGAPVPSGPAHSATELPHGVIIGTERGESFDMVDPASAAQQWTPVQSEQQQEPLVVQGHISIQPPQRARVVRQSSTATFGHAGNTGAATATPAADRRNGGGGARDSNRPSDEQLPPLPRSPLGSGSR